MTFCFKAATARIRSDVSERQEYRVANGIAPGLRCADGVAAAMREPVTGSLTVSGCALFPWLLVWVGFSFDNYLALSLRAIWRKGCGLLLDEARADSAYGLQVADPTSGCEGKSSHSVAFTRHGTLSAHCMSRRRNATLGRSRRLPLP